MENLFFRRGEKPKSVSLSLIIFLKEDLIILLWFHNVLLINTLEPVYYNQVRKNYNQVRKNSLFSTIKYAKTTIKYAKTPRVIPAVLPNFYLG